MKQSFKAKRLAKHHKRFSAGAKLNLVSLMDIFTILVFFLIVNQSEIRVLQNIKEINLPVSIAKELPAENVLITVLPQRIMIQERVVWQQNSALTEVGVDINSDLIDAVKTELSYLATKRPVLTETEKENGRAVTIIGDASVPYQVLKQIMSACADSNYRNISLAVKQIAKSKLREG
ncbi:RNA polymerase subunit sigma-70 [Colwellia sp. MT41]|uniref:ExbD/TolR family protein n=1 Tax=Colwellia sp. MT41 TaxID=58049 RepID=UPI000717A964|nr:biopolymer transporter ExbD [Colwellia sp. MT41]ALO33714.1 RNA polymerase subunit sigma-70 [Colwellia sp. MT41]